MAQNSGTTTKIQLAVMAEKITNIEKTVLEIKLNQQKDYTPLTRFTPVEKIVYGFIAVALIGVAGALINQVIIR